MTGERQLQVACLSTFGELQQRNIKTMTQNTISMLGFRVPMLSIPTIVCNKEYLEPIHTYTERNTINKQMWSEPA